MVTTTKRKEAPTGNAPMGATSPKAVTSCFPQEGRNQTTEASEVVFDPIQGDEGVETLPQCLPQSTSRRSPLFFPFFKLANKSSDNILNIIIIIIMYLYSVQYLHILQD